MARISGVDLPNNKRVEIGLTYIYGIGPATAKKIIEEHGGKIWANSVEGEGTTISFVLRKYKECVTYE